MCRPVERGQHALDRDGNEDEHGRQTGRNHDRDYSHGRELARIQPEQHQPRREAIGEHRRERRQECRRQHAQRAGDAGRRDATDVVREDKRRHEVRPLG